MIKFPEYKEIVDRIKADVFAKLPDVDPTLAGSIISAVVTSLAGRVFDITLLQKQIVEQMSPLTADAEHLEQWAAYEGLTRKPATEATGDITLTGTPGSTVLSGVKLSSKNGNLYTTTAGITLTSQSWTLNSLTRSGSVVTGITSSDHYISSGMEITIAGANESDYNGTFQVTATSNTEFTYNISTTPSTPATGTITAGFDGGTVEVISDELGVDQNADTGSTLSLVSPISGVDSTAYVRYDGVLGGFETETDASLLSRTMQSRSQPVTNFNAGAIEKQARQISYVSRVYVKRIYPEVGDVTILFLKEGTGTDAIPGSAEETEVKETIMEIAPANTGDAQVFVEAPTPVTTNYLFTSINPDTPTMRTAITNNLNAFYEDDVDFEQNISEDKYRSAIINTVDLETGESLSSFTLSTPSTDIVVSTKEIGVLGTITFS